MNSENWLSRVPDPCLFSGLEKEAAERWAGYFFRFPEDPEKSATLKTRTFALYDPFARRDKFPAGIRYCVNVFAGCSHKCAYCYAKNYIVRAEQGREKKDLIRMAKRDIEDLKNLNLPAIPLHLSNSTDPLQEPLESSIGTTLALIRLIAENRRHFTTVTFLTKNPILLAQESYLSLLKALEPCQVEVSIIFLNDKVRKFYEPGAPTIESRLEGIQKLRKAGIKVSLRIDPLMAREPLPMKYWTNSELKFYGVEQTHTLEEIKSLVQFAASEGCQKIIVSALKVPIGRRSPCWLKSYFYRLYSEPFGGKPRISSLYMRLPEDYIHNELFQPVAELCNHYSIPMVHCKHNLITTK